MGIEGKIVVCRPPPLHEMTFDGHTLLFKVTISKMLNIPTPFPMRSARACPLCPALFCTQSLDSSFDGLSLQ
jgi:hypothetical protein